MNLKTNNSKYKTNSKINLYKENMIKFIISQKNKIVPIGLLESIDYIVGILFLTESNRYFKCYKINSHGYYLAYTFINLFYKIRLKILKSYDFNYHDIKHFILSLSLNIDYFNSRIDPTNIIKNKINSNLSKFQVNILEILIDLFEYKKIHDKENLEISDENLKNNLINYNFDNNSKFCNINCYQCLITNILSKFFYLLLLTAKFLGTGIYNDPNLLRLSDYYANIFYTWFKSNNEFKIDINSNINNYEMYENYLNYKNKLNYSLIELNLGTDTIDEIIDYIDKDITYNLSIKIK